MQDKALSVTELRNLIGHEVHFEGRRCQIIEILEDGPALILQHQEHFTTIQPDQHGEAHRKVPSTVTVHVFDHENGGVNPAFHSMQLDSVLKS